jgi:hypothetical protein
MRTKARIDLELHWALKEALFHTDKFYDGLRDIKAYPYRLYLNDELLAERDFNVHDRFYMLETHFLTLPPGQYTLRIEELTGLLDVDIRNFKLDSVRQPSWVFNIGT